MPAHPTRDGLADYQGHVEKQLREGESFSAVEDYIDTAPLESRQRAALWLLAWAHQTPRAQLRLAKETLALVSTALGPTP